MGLGDQAGCLNEDSALHVAARPLGGRHLTPEDVTPGTNDAVALFIPARFAGLQPRVD